MNEKLMPMPTSDKKTPSFFSKYKFTIISLCVILVALIPLIILARHTKTTPAMMHTQAVIQPTPTTIPLTEHNVQPTLDATSQKVQSTLDSSSQDLQAASQVNTTDDSVQGL